MRGRKRRVLVAVVLVMVSLLAGDALWWEPRHPQLRTYDVALPGLPAEMDGFRVCQITDPHRHTRLSDSLIAHGVAMANSTSPDLLVLTGDYAGQDKRDYEPSAALLAQVQTRLGTFAVLGNHDHWAGPSHAKEALTAHGIQLLDNDAAEVSPGLWLAGIDDESSGRPDEGLALGKVPKGTALIALAHDPKSSARFSDRSCLLLVGHTHGGQVLVPPIPRNCIPGLLFRSKWISGWYREGRALMYVSRGLGMSMPTARFLCRPEVTLYVLHPGDGDEVRVLDQQESEKV